jgi:hypothetical protein
MDGIVGEGAKLPSFGRSLKAVEAKYIEAMLEKAVNRFSKI